MGKRLPGSIVFEDDTGTKHIINTPSLNVLFRSEKLRQAFDKNPDEKYSVNDLIKMMGNIAPSKNTLREKIRHFNVYFEDNDETETRFEKKKLVTVKVVKLTPLVKFVFDSIYGDNEDDET